MVNPKKRENLESSQRTTKQHSGKNNINDGIKNKKQVQNSKLMTAFTC